MPNTSPINPANCAALPANISTESKRLLELTQKQLVSIKKLVSISNAPPSLNELMDSLTRLQKVCNSIKSGGVGIEARFCKADFAFQKKVLAEKVAETRRDRDAILKMMVVGMLSGIEQKASSQLNADMGKELIRSLTSFTMVKDVPPGLIPERALGNGYYASANAKEFFDVHLRSVLKKLDKHYKFNLETLVPQPYDHKDPNSLVAWSLAWSQATAAVAVDWLFKKGARSLGEVIEMLKNLPLSQFFVNRTTSGGGTLPTKLPAIYAEFWARPFLCQILKHDPQLSTSHKRYEVVHFRLDEISDQTEGGFTYVAGLGNNHLYLAVWLERVSLLLANLPNPSTNPMNPKIKNVSPPNVIGYVAPGQYQTIQKLIENYDHPENISRGGGSWYARTESTDDAIDESVVSTESLDPDTESEVNEESPVFHIHNNLLKFRPAPVEVDECVGSVVFAWEDLCPEYVAEWMDVTFIVRRDGVWHTVALEVEAYSKNYLTEEELQSVEAEEKDEKAKSIDLVPFVFDKDRVSLSVNSGLTDPQVIKDLREVLEKAVWVGKLAGLGVFVAGAVDLDSAD